MCRRPEEGNALQKAQIKRRVAQRCQRPANIADQENEKHKSMGLALTEGIGAQNGADQQHGSTRGAHHTRDHRAEGEQCGIGGRRADQRALHQYATAGHVKRQQQGDEGQVFLQQDMPDL